MKLNSIRWRLVLSYVLLTILTVSMVGFLGLTLVNRFIETKIESDLRTNAESIARQAAPFMRPQVDRFELTRLAQTAAILGNGRIRILDAQRQVVVDSGPQQNISETIWVIPASELGIPEVIGPIIIPIPNELRSGPFFDDPPFLTDEMVFKFAPIIVERRRGPWGDHIVFTQQGLSLVHQEITREMTPPGAKNSPGDLNIEGFAAPSISKTIVVPIGEPEAPLGYVELTGENELQVEAMATIRQAFLLAGAGSALVAIVVGLLIGRSLSNPLQILTGTASRMSEGDLSIRAPERGPGEIAQLARQFNQMATRLETSFQTLAAERDTLRRFIADASHELRTPITALKNFNELLQGPAIEDSETREEFITESKAQLDRLEWITKNLLDLSRLEAGISALDLGKHDLTDLIEATLPPFQTRAKEKGNRLNFQRPVENVPVICDRGRLELAISNLLDNSIKFTPPGGTITINVTQTDKWTEIQIQDTGIGIPEADLPHVFDRFYRGKNHQTEGSGLGLAIVQSIAKAHGGDIYVESKTGDGSRFKLALPPENLASPTK